MDDTDNGNGGGKNTPLIVLAVVLAILAIIWAWRLFFSSTANTPGTEGPTHGPVQNTQLDKTSTSLEELIHSARSWQPVFTDYYGKNAPELAGKDINGKQVSTSTYKEKSPLMVVFWATWCPPCQEEVPELKQLRMNMPENELAMIAVSNEDEATLKQYSAQKQINYMVMSVSGRNLSEPYASIEAIPTTLFIDKYGKIRLACEGAVSQKEAKLILNAIESGISSGSSDANKGEIKM